MFFLKKKMKDKEIIEISTTVLDQKVEAIIRYTHNYSGFNYRMLCKRFPRFEEETDDYLSAFMELYTAAALSVALHSPSISESKFYGNVLSALERQTLIYFESNGEDMFKFVLNCIDFYKKHAIKIIKRGYNFSDIPAFWLLYNLEVYKDFENDYVLIEQLGNELTNHFIYIFEDTWEYKEVDPLEML
ncbi:hypothetical protein EHS13_02145 [Paenibacillus psychroresistens]|uniref:Uncharacterized protein n=1 Tax=Paenibacillus psychroresistens TaxID=1778678 RepID=A0A6B8REA3_9BACL|nr:hypothetical protein [Paenibacillus psychroresistens]QGQ93788.1 hypothetical protein EHS13_02145 [Paenibacillus psychroresistens]